MSRRASLPGAAELFRRTGSPASAESSAADPGSGTAHDPAQERGAEVEQENTTRSSGRSPGKRKHDAKITVYLSGAELLALEHARLTLRGTHELAVDRGRIVRESVAVLLEDFDAHGEDSVLVRRLRGADSTAPETAN